MHTVNDLLGLRSISRYRNSTGDRIGGANQFLCRAFHTIARKAYWKLDACLDQDCHRLTTAGLVLQVQLLQHERVLLLLSIAADHWRLLQFLRHVGQSLVRLRVAVADLPAARDWCIAIAAL